MKEFMLQAKKEYMHIGKVFCPYLGQEVRFSKQGFRHLIFKAKNRRQLTDILERLKAIRFIADILSKSGTLQEYEKIDTEFFGFIAIVRSKKFKVVVLKDKSGKYLFISVIPKYQTGIRNINQKPTQKE